MSTPAILILSTADWDRPLWTNKQHLAKALARHVPKLWYVNSMGLRRPSLQPADLKRIGNRLRALAVPGRQLGIPVPPEISVITPKVIPVHRLTWPTARLNRRLLERGVAEWLARPSEERVLWTFSPVTYGLHEQAARTVYHCVDLLEEVPGYDRVAIRQGEAALAAAGVAAVASSRVVREHLVDVGFRDPLLWENVADADLISRLASQETARTNHVVFAGNLTPLKVDFPLLLSLADEHPELTLELAGPAAEGGGDASAVDQVRNHPRIRLHGALTPQDMARLLGQCTVGIVPYVDNRYTSGVFPMKIYEYLAAGLAVVSTNLPSLAAVGEIKIAADRGSFIRAVAELAGSTPSEAQVRSRQRVAAANSWAVRGRQALDLVWPSPTGGHSEPSLTSTPSTAGRGHRLAR